MDGDRENLGVGVDELENVPPTANRKRKKKRADSLASAKKQWFQQHVIA